MTRTYGEDDDEPVNWMHAGMLWITVKGVSRHDVGEPQMRLVVKGVYIGDFSCDVLWTEYFLKNY